MKNLFFKFWFWLIIFWSLVFLVFFFPKWFVQPAINQSLDFSKSGNIGDTIGGIMGPFIAIIAAFVTFIAFWVQYRANEMLRKDIAVERFENKFYELMKLHRENVKELNIQNKIMSREVFIQLFDELRFCFYSVDACINKNGILLIEELDKIEIAFSIFFFGTRIFNDSLISEVLKKYDKEMVRQILEKIENSESTNFGNFKVNYKGEPKNFTPSYYPFRGHYAILGHYYRHLFQTVKFVHEYDSKVIDFNEKKGYLKTLRAQLSSHEQLLLYYNSLTGAGSDWNIPENDFLRKYRLIKNIPLPLADFGITPKEKLGERNDDGELLFEWDE